MSQSLFKAQGMSRREITFRQPEEQSEVSVLCFRLRVTLH